MVTVLFADLVGFTSLSEHRDPEQVKRLVDELFELLVADVEEHGGAVDKVLGDAIIALFGAPVAHEDDADRAVRSAMAMQSTLRSFRDTHPADEVRMRVGINTGEVLVGTLAGTDYTAMGDVVNTASRLQELAPAGAVLVGDATRQLCSPVVRFVGYDRTQLRGRMSDTEVWQAVAVDTAMTARRWQSDVPFVGRGTEREMLHAVTSIVRSGRGAVVAIAGEAGIGKSRLVHETVSALIEERPGALLLEGACAPYGESNLWWPVAGSLLSRLGLDRTFPPEEARDRVVRRLAPFEELEPGTSTFDRIVELTLHLLGHPSALDELSPAATRDAVFGGIQTVLRARMRRDPVIIWIDDVQWAAPLLLELLEAAARQLGDLPLLIAVTYRPDEDGALEWPPPVDPAVTLHLSLEPLPDDEAAELVAAASQRELAPGVVDDISHRSGGNPLFLIELARMAATTPDLDGELPGSMRALIASRLDELTPSQRAILDNAAILGNVGPVTALRDFAAAVGQSFDAADVDVLESRGLLVREDSRWRFRSDVVREVAYRTLTKQARAQRHAGVAMFLAENADGLIDLRAHHSATAAELRAEIGPVPFVPEDMAARAADLLGESARRWYHQGAHRRGTLLVERALGLPDVAPGVRRELALLLVEGLVELRDTRRARATLAELEPLVALADDRVAEGEMYRFRGMVEQLDGDLVASRRELARAVDVFRELGDRPHLAEALRVRGFTEIFGGSLSDAEVFLQEATQLFDETGDERGGAWVQQHTAWISFLSGDHDESKRRLEHSIETFETLGDRSGKAWTKGLLAYVHHFGRNNDEAERLAAEALAEARQWGDEWGASMMLNLRASIRLWSGDPESARSLAERALAGFREVDDQFGMLQSLGTLNRTYVALGRFNDAERSVEEVLVLSDSFGELAYASMAAAGTAMHLGQGARAAELARSAIDRIDTTGANIDEGRVVLAFGRMLDGDPEGALTTLLDVDVEASPFALAARATASALTGDAETALADALAVEAMSEISYWDRMVAAVAGLGVAEDHDLEMRMASLDELCDRVDDAVIVSYARDVIARRRGQTRSEGDKPPGGWASIAERVVV